MQQAGDEPGSEELQRAVGELEVAVRVQALREQAEAIEEIDGLAYAMAAAGK